MQNNSFLYLFSYNINESDLCKLESRQLFQKEERDKVLLSAVRCEPSHSAFIKKRLEILLSSESYDELLFEIENEKIVAEGFKVEYLSVDDDDTSYAEGLEKLSDIGRCIQGIPDMKHPTKRYGLCHYAGLWCFGLLSKNDYGWKAHKKKPRSYSNSINIHIAKALVNIASNGHRDTLLLDACCGVGTVLLEACYAGQPIEGVDINWRVCVQSRENLAHFDYQANVYRSDIADVEKHYDAAIIDLPYNLFSCADELTHLHIIQSAAKVTSRLVIVSTSDILPLIQVAGFRCVDYCSVKKRGKKHFERKIWVCER